MMDSFQIPALLAAAESNAELYTEFLRVPSMSVGIYQLKAGAVDPQELHHEDEVYFVVSGKAYIQVGDEQEALEAGSIVFVPAYKTHSFFDIQEDLNLLVFFAPAESS
jgi:mannose-6-phosphate isomerase-like protein (cupin superfamily)